MLDQTNVRLPQYITPLKYYLDIYIDMKNINYRIHCNLEMIINKKNVKMLILNANLDNYNIESISISKLDHISDSYNSYVDVSYNISQDLSMIEQSIYISLDTISNLEIGDKIMLNYVVNGKISLSTEKSSGLFFSLFGNDAKLLDNPHNFYKIWETEPTNIISNSVICASNEPVECRSYMPCFDEPCFKSKFKIKISIDKKYVTMSKNFKVLSNGELMDIIYNETTERYQYVFSESPLMSIYLLTFVIGNFEYIESIVDKTQLRVFTPVGNLADGSFAMDIAKKSLEFYQKYFKIPYSFPKMDLVPIPAFDYRAMENWGCIIYLNYALMANRFLDIKERKSIARTNAHEISHMWFGNLVTMVWWEDIWLNEGFARFMEFICLEHVQPEFEIWSKYIELIYQNAFDIDERSNTHAVRRNVTSPKDLPDIFDTISYAKGASIIRMLYFYVGEEKFREAIVAYLEKFKYKNTCTEDLWNCFRDTINIEVKSIMNDWVNLSGHPAIYANVFINDIDNDNCNETKLFITQNPFPSNFNCDNSDPIWKIPLYIKTKNQEYTFLMETKNCEFNIKSTFNISYSELKIGSNFIKINSDMKGFYRVFYDFNILVNSILYNVKSLTSLDISGLLSDYFAKNDMRTCLEILNSVKPINNYLTLSYAMKIYNYIKEIGFQHSCFKDIIDREKYGKEINLENLLKKFFSDLVDVDVDILIDKLYLSDSSAYSNECEDEFHELVLNIYAFIRQDLKLINFIVKNFEKYSHRMHKNFKYLIYGVVINFSHMVLDDLKKEIDLYNLIMNEYISSYFDHSLQARGYFKCCLTRFENTSDNLAEFFISQLNIEENFRKYYFKNLNLYVNCPLNRRKFLTIYIRKLKEIKEKYFSEGKNWNIVLCSTDDNFHIINDLNFMIKGICHQTIREDLINYLINELKQSSQNENDNEMFASMKKYFNNSHLHNQNAMYNSSLKQLIEYFS